MTHNAEIIYAYLKKDAPILLDIRDTDEYSHGDKDFYVEIMPMRPFKIPFKLIEPYQKDAKRILDAESKKLNHEGIKRLMAALLIEILGNANFGKEN